MDFRKVTTNFTDGTHSAKGKTLVESGCHPVTYFGVGSPVATAGLI